MKSNIFKIQLKWMSIGIAVRSKSNICTCEQGENTGKRR